VSFGEICEIIGGLAVYFIFVLIMAKFAGFNENIGGVAKGDKR
jgi:hypothetical protein